MITNDNTLVPLSEVSQRRIHPILNRIIKRNKLSLHEKKHEQLTQYILSNLSSDTIFDESDRNLFYLISQLIDSDAAINIMGDSLGQLKAKKRSNYDIRHKETIRLFLREYFELFFPNLAEKMKRKKRLYIV